MSSETKLREEMIMLARSMFKRGLTPGSTGNLSVRLDDGGFLMTPTNASFGFLDPAALSKLDANGEWRDGDKPTKEAFLHLAMYRANNRTQSVSHLHSTYSVCLSCLQGLDAENLIPPLTPYLQMRVGPVALAPYRRPGDSSLGPEVEKLARKYNGIIIANHGPLVAGKSLRDSVFAMEELEESARLSFLLRGQAVNLLNREQLAELDSLSLKS